MKDPVGDDADAQLARASGPRKKRVVKKLARKSAAAADGEEGETKVSLEFL